MSGALVFLADGMITTFLDFPATDVFVVETPVLPIPIAMPRSMYNIAANFPHDFLAAFLTIPHH